MLAIDLRLLRESRDFRLLWSFELPQVASTPALGNVEAGVVALLTSLRFSVVSGGVACVVGAVAVLAALPSLVRYDAWGRVPGTVPGTNA